VGTRGREYYSKSWLSSKYSIFSDKLPELDS
jgi:hypothetical protein